MAIRREDIEDWKLEIYQSSVPGAIELAWLTRIDEELAHHEK